MKFSEILSLRIQKFLGLLVLLPLAGIVIFILVVVRKYRVENITEIRREYHRLCGNKVPLLLCANHLTMIDSMIIHWALSGTFWYACHYNRFAWNLPAVENFGSSVLRRVTTYLSKCILIDRRGEKQHFERIFRHVHWLLNKNETCMIFPEGTRSRSGKIEVENAMYGTGQIILDTPGCQVLCIYLRGHNQPGFSEVPPKGARFNIQLSLLEPHSNQTGRRAQRDLTLQVMHELKKMEERYFSAAKGHD